MDFKEARGRNDILYLDHLTGFGVLGVGEVHKREA